DNRFYGARNAFDDGQNVANGIRYSSWLSGKKADWIRIRLAQDTGTHTVGEMTVRAEDPEYPADTMQITIGFEDRTQQQFASVRMTPPLTTYSLPAPANNVSFLRLVLEAVKAIFKIDEIQVLAQPSHPRHVPGNTPYF